LKLGKQQDANQRADRTRAFASVAEGHLPLECRC
jgi:hypothetical protein